MTPARLFRHRGAPGWSSATWNHCATDGLAVWRRGDFSHSVAASRRDPPNGAAEQVATTPPSPARQFDQDEVRGSRPGRSPPGSSRPDHSGCCPAAAQRRIPTCRVGDRPGNRPGLSCGFCGGAPRRNRTADPILTMEPPGTAVRTAASPGRARPWAPKLSVLFRPSYAFTPVTADCRPSLPVGLDTG
jgi:hypothetical protein